MRDWIETHGLPVGVAVAVGAIAAAAAAATMGRPAPATIEVRPLQVQPTPTAPIYVHVEGAVNAPGVYTLPSGARVFEAIEVAGGATDDADISLLNLAAKAADGQKLVVPSRAASADIGAAAGAPLAPTPAAAARAGPAPRINVNTATQRVLESLPGIGPVTAQRIIEYRQANGPFARIEQLREIRIVNASTYERIKDLITVG